MCPDHLLPLNPAKEYDEWKHNFYQHLPVDQHDPTTILKAKNHCVACLKRWETTGSARSFGNRNADETAYVWTGDTYITEKEAKKSALQ